MKRFSEQLQKKAQTVRLSGSEKSDLRDRVVSYMEYHPLPVTLKATDNPSLLLEDTKVSLINIKNWRFFQGSLAIFVLALISVPYLAEKTVPGDSLYAVKVNFNEEIRSTLTRGSYEKVVWETERLNRRIAEARLLASEGRLTDQVQAEVANAVRSHSENAQREIAVLKKTDQDVAVLASLQLETALDVQTQVLANEGPVNDIGTTEGKPSLIAAAVADSKQLAGNATVGETLPAYNKLMAYVESETTRAYELLKNIQTTATEEEKADIERRLQDINRVITDANAQKDNNEEGSRQELVKVLQQTQKLIIFMNNIGIRKVVTVEQIVPVVLTIEERNQTLKISANKILALTKAVEPTLKSTSTAIEIRDKFTPVLTDVIGVASTTLTLLPMEEDNLVSAELSLTEAIAKVRDIATVLDLDFRALEAGIVIEKDLPENQNASSSVEISASTTVEISASSSGETIKATDNISTEDETSNINLNPA